MMHLTILALSFATTFVSSLGLTVHQQFLSYRHRTHPVLNDPKKQCIVSLQAHLNEFDSSETPSTFVILGGTGKIGTAVACHLLHRGASHLRVVLVGRCGDEKGQQAVENVRGEWEQLQQQQQRKNAHGEASSPTSVKRDDICVEYAYVRDVWDNTDPNLRTLVQDADALIHVAGPFLNRRPTPLELAIECECSVYVDVSDPIAFLETSLLQSDRAKESKTTALLAAGAFPGMSNVLAVEASEAALNDSTSSYIRDVRFSYFTAGLGGSGALNLYITNLGFGEPMAQFSKGQLEFYPGLSGRLIGEVDFFLDDEQQMKGSDEDAPRFGNEAARRRIGRRSVFAWPFPEAATVPTNLEARGSSVAAMGTAPNLWNLVLGFMVERFVPLAWWQSPRFCKFLADFSEPLVKVSDAWLQWQDRQDGGTGETHGMRVDVTVMSADPDKDGILGMSVVQAHDSFRRCVGQSCAEFALDALEFPHYGIYLPEQRYKTDTEARKRIIKQLTATPGTFCYTGPVQVERISPPTNLGEVLDEVAQW